MDELLERTLRPDSVGNIEERGMADGGLSAASQPTGGLATMHASQMQGSTLCPRCGAEMDSDADYCESCHSYVKVGICSFCGAEMDETAAFCPECGNSRKGIVCPVCHKVNEFAFCKQCGTALTDEARQAMDLFRAQPEYERLNTMIQEIVAYDNVLPYRSERDVVKDNATENLRRRVLELLAEDGMPSAETAESPLTVSKHKRKRMSAEELEQRKTESIQALTKALESVSLKPCASPVAARNYVMATKPQGIKAAWMCNYKNAMHGGPCECAKPHLGGKWIIIK